MKLYTEVNKDGFVVRSLFTHDPAAEVAEGNKLLPDSPPVPGIDYIINEEKVIRIHPVPEDATEILYQIIKAPKILISKGNEVEI